MRQAASKTSNKLIVSLVIGFMVLITVSIVVYQQTPEATFATPDLDIVKADEAASNLEAVLTPNKSEQAETMSEIDLMVEELADRMKKQFADNIHQIAIQLSLKNLRDDLNRSYHEQGNEIFVRILNKAFPEWVSAILKALALMDEYEDWLQGILVSLNDMNLLEQQGVLWAKRRELFGDAATQVWQEEISAEQERQATMNRTMELLDRSYDTQMQERIYILQSTFQESYADRIQNMLIDPKGVLSQVFFGFDAVQKDLKALSPEERQAQINDIRKTMGFSDEQVKAQAESDQLREKRWQNGYAYMEARKLAESQFSGDQLTQEMDKLREKFFAHEANTIKKEEEEMGFDRYARPHRYGLN